MVPKWRVDFDSEIQTDAIAEGLSRADAGMACGLACLRMIERWAIRGAKPKTYRTWLRRTGQTKEHFRKEGVLWPTLTCAIKEWLREVCDVDDELAVRSIPERLNRCGENAVVLAWMRGCYWPHKNGRLLDDVKHYIVVPQAEWTCVRPMGKPEWFVSIADPLRAYLTFESWKRQVVLIEEAVLISRTW